MDRDALLEKVLGIDSKAILLEYGTGTGKTKLALEKTVQVCGTTPKLLIVTPQHAVDTSWDGEIIKWGFSSILPTTTIICYNSLKKYVGETWDMIICDEAHHLTEIKREILSVMTTSNIIFLSATMPRKVLQPLQRMFPELYIATIKTRKAIEEGILADPKIILVPLKLETTGTTCKYEVNPKAAHVYPKVLPLSISNYWTAKKQGGKKIKYTFAGSQFDYYKVISSLIDTYKRKSSNEAMRNAWLKLSGDRLIWLAKQKTPIVKEILKKLSRYRTLTFCCDVEHSKVFGPNSINYKDGNATEILTKFNEGKINHIQACSMLDEGVNLVNCKVGIFANINASERMITQRNGRILRHQSPVIVLPFYTGTREEEIVKTMLEDYNSKLVTTIQNINDLKL